MHLKMCIHYSNRKLPKGWPVIRYVCVYYWVRVNIVARVWLLILHGNQIFIDFVRFLIHDSLLIIMLGVYSKYLQSLVFK